MNNINFFVYTGGKTGGSTLTTTLEYYYNKTQVLHTHSDYWLRKKHNYNDGVLNLIENNSKIHDEIYVFCVYREPISRTISSFFQNLRKRYKSFEDLTTLNLINDFDNNNFFEMENYYPQIDILTRFFTTKDFEFDFTKSYVIKKKHNINFVFMRFDDLSIWGKILSEILKTEIILFSSNLSTQKNYYKLYQDFKENYKVSDCICKNLIEDKLLNIFHTEIERDMIIKKWC